MSQRFWTAHYAAGVPADIELPASTLADVFDAAVAEASDSPAVQFFGQQLTYGQLGDQAARAAAGLHRLGVRPGDRVALVMPNCPQHVAALFAVFRLGAIVVEHNPTYTHPELKRHFDDHGARIVVVWDGALEQVLAEGDIPLDHVVVVSLAEDVPSDDDRLLSWSQLIAGDPIDDSVPRPSSTDIACIQYTSGTTGLPKGTILTHFNLVSNVAQIHVWLTELEMRKEVFYSVLPQFHVFGLTVNTFLAVRVQALMVLFPQLDGSVTEAMVATPPTVFIAAPPMFHGVGIQARAREIKPTGMKYCISGASKLSQETVDLWEGQFGGMLNEGYGMTESSPVTFINPYSQARKVGTIGICISNTDFKVVSITDPTVEVAQGEAGELLVRGPQVFSGYWNNPVETELALLPGGWLRTGDVVTVDDDGFVTIVDRLKEIVITSGLNVSPTEVEQVLVQHPAIAEAAVVGEPDIARGERVIAAVVLAEGAELDVREVKDFCKDKLAAHKIPRKFTVLEALPKTGLGKVQRRVVREMLT